MTTILSARSTTGTVLSVSKVPLGSVLDADAASGATSIVVADTTDFDGEFGGTLSVNGATYAYDSVDDATGTITLASGLTAAAADGDRVDVWNVPQDAAAVEYRALVELPGDFDNADPINARVALPLVPMLPEGEREPGQGEIVVIVDQDGEKVATDLPGVTPQIGGELIRTNSIPQAALAFTLADGTTVTVDTVAPSSPTVGDIWIDAGNDNVIKQWDGSAWVPYQFGPGAIASGAIDPSKITFTARDIGGVTTSFAASAPAGAVAGDLWYDTSNDYQLNRYDGSAWVAVQFGADAIAAGSVDPTKITFSARDIGGITTTFAASAPVGAVAGDLWYDTSNGNKLNRYNGTAWVAAQFGANAIATGAIDTSKVTFTARDIGGVTTSFAASAPAGAVAGDLWYDTSNGNKLNRYSGTAWVAAQLGTNAISAGAITASLIAADTITASQIAAGAITTSELAANAVTAANIAAGTITAAQIAAGTITAALIAGDTITASQIAAGAITTSELAAGAVTAAKIAAGTITATEIAAGTITAALIAGDTITAAQIAAGAITTSELAAGAVTAAKITAGTITANEIASGTITGDRIAASTLTSDLIAAGAILAEHIAVGALDAATIRAISLSAVTMSGRMVGSVLSSSDFLVDGDGGRVLAYAQTPTIDLDTSTPGSGSFTAPVAGQYKVEGWGGGGSGSQNGGGSGGEYAYDLITLTAGQVVPYTVGAGGVAGPAGADGGNTTFDVLTAHGGKAGDLGTDANAPGGIGSTNAVHFAGGRGGKGFAGKAGGGGSSAGVSLAGHDGADATFSANGSGGAAQPGGGAGGAGSSTGNGTAGSTPGGGGGGSVSANGGAGASGKLRVTHYVSSPLVAIASAAGTDSYGNSYPGGATIYPLTITDCNTALTPGSYYGVGGTVVNSPNDTKSWALYVHGRGTPGTSPNVGRSLMQIAHRIDVTTTTTSPAEIWARTCSAGGAWQSWYQISGPPVWTAVTAAAGYAGTDWAVARFADGKVRLRGQVSKTGGFTTGYATAGTLPSSAYAPTTDVRVPICAAASGGVFGVLRIDQGSTSIQISAQTGATPAAFYTTSEWDSL